MDTMLILRGIAGTFNGKRYPGGALDEKSAKEYAELRGYLPYVLPVSGETGVNSRQTKAALKEFRKNEGITALYGFSGGGYNIKHILSELSTKEKTRIKLIIVIGAPKQPEVNYKGDWELVYRKDPP